jgi:hypothetical protein
MKKDSLKAVALMLGAAMSFSLSACGDDDDDKKSDIEYPDYWRQEVKELTDDDINAAAMSHFVDYLVNPTDNGTVTLRNASVLDASLPSVYTMGVTDYAEATDYLLGLSLKLDTLSNGIYQLDFGTYGSATFRRNASGGTLLATLDIQVSELADVSQLRFVDKTTLPESNGGIEWTRGMIVENEKLGQFICVEESEFGSPYRLVRFYPESGKVTTTGYNWIFCSGYPPEEGFLFQSVENLNADMMCDETAQALHKFIVKKPDVWNDAFKHFCETSGQTTCRLFFGADRSWRYHNVSRKLYSAKADYETLAKAITTDEWSLAFYHYGFTLSESWLGYYRVYNCKGVLTYLADYGLNQFYYDGEHFGWSDYGTPYYRGLTILLLSDYTLTNIDDSWKIVYTPEDDEVYDDDDDDDE